ncbi:bifunctional 2-polyprenyl-6-hydroxyphenol methylase/3-demethylubiquinol 3-O-methyltransferase UbiG [uncultured Microscilla sp.]|uniref:class I SAM-dependent methyltransferase n=1 Tax=uncultured Microscilla sp. TaxID=432653 RepID=UPI0026342B63|nr:class I SAM-dependent methyltransferase [uncultured Microscilla sp.]
MFKTTEITSNEIVSDNPVHQRLTFAYEEAIKYVSGNLLEIGCGFGRGLETLQKVCDQYTAIDKNDKLIAWLSEQYKDFTFLSQNIPPFTGLQDNTYDFVVSFQVIEHIKDDNLYLKEINRVLKPGGKALITTPNIKYSLTRNPWHIREYTAQELATLMGRYFSQVDTHGVKGNEKVMDYYNQNKKSVEKITRWDVFNLQYRLPRQVLQVPYDILNRMNRKKLQKQDNSLVAQINFDDYYLSDRPDESLDLYYIATK